MKEIVAYIRPDRHFATRDALEKAGFGAYHVENVSGRGRQGLVYEMIEGGFISPEYAGGQMFAKKEFTIAVANDEVDIVIKIFLDVNQTGTKGDGKIFVLPLENAVRIRTGEQGEGALL
ncbi:MAG: P-II family nitrogen regulator [Clostridiales bacterium]|nr:P-II family nitrogen regulator [Clostridiales bacterium]